MSFSGQSNYIDSGWVIDSSGQQVPDGATFNEVSVDVYCNVSQVGVYGMMGNSSITNVTYSPMFCSTINISYFDVSQSDDEAYVVYPGFGIQLFTLTSYGGTGSNICNNNTTQPVVFTTENSSISGTLIYELNTSTPYPKLTTSSLKIFYRGLQITCSTYS